MSSKPPNQKKPSKQAGDAGIRLKVGDSVTVRHTHWGNAGDKGKILEIFKGTVLVKFERQPPIFYKLNDVNLLADEEKNDNG